MPSNTREIKRRLKSVKNIRQITRAMQLVATSKMRKAQTLSTNADAYAYGALEILLNITRLGGKENQHSFWSKNDSPKVCLVLVTTNRGFCGGLNISLFSEILTFIRQKRLRQSDIEVVAIGKKGRAFAKKTGLTVIADFSEISDKFSIKELGPIMKIAMGEYQKKYYGEVIVAYSQFINTLSQKSIVRSILPITVQSFESITEIDKKAKKIFNPPRTTDLSERPTYVFEPDIESVFQHLIPHLVETELYKIILESHASEHSARMMAMKNATDKAGELIDGLNLAYNQARQAAITKEIAEISSGAMATI